MKTWLSEHKNEIIVGIIVSIITTIIIKFGDVIITILPEAGNSFLVAIRNSIYYSAGRQGPNSVSSLIFSCLLGVFAGMISYLPIWHFQRKKQIEKISKEYEELYHQKNDNKMLEKAGKDKTKIKKKKSSLSKSVLAIIFVILIVFWGFVSVVLPATMWKEFELRINQIAPYVQDIEIKQLRSKWVSMYTKEDYDEINSYIIKIKEENNLK